MSQIEVTLGEATVPVYPQRHAYLTNKLGKWFAELTQSGDDVGSDDVMAWVMGNSYEVLSVLIPTLPKRMAKWEWDGYGSADAAAAGDYDESQDKSPTVPQIIDAFNVAIEVNRFDIIKAVLKVVDPNLLRQWINAQLAERILTSSQNSLRASGESDQTSSGATSPTSMASAA